ncbi:unnamed protein product [Rotaria sp. Silwood1]|nr:unnamed protein product [Rotaria sp. Silwood1]
MRKILYQCTNSKKLISKHRFIDGISDCVENDDELYNASYALNHTYRRLCPNENKCLSPILSQSSCTMYTTNEDRILSIPFQMIRSNIPQVIPLLIDGRIESDETDYGEQWPCSNMYTRCDHSWTCENRSDETGCFHSTCSSFEHDCVSPINLTMICLSMNRTNNGIIDCFGATNEMTICRDKHPNQLQGFHCANSDQCVSCLSMSYNPIVHYFKLASPSSTTHMENKQDVIYSILNRPEEPFWALKCNRGLRLRQSIGFNQFVPICLCPPSYYGDQCQYQNQRVSLTLSILTEDLNTDYILLVMLINNDKDKQEIHTYEEIIHKSQYDCPIKYNIYLLYSSRPKVMSNNYSIRIDVFTRRRNSIDYHASWNLPIPFIFLPVNRLATQINIPTKKKLNCYFDESLMCLCTDERHANCFKLKRYKSYLCRRNDYCMNNGECFQDKPICPSTLICVCSNCYYGDRCQFYDERFSLSLDAILNFEIKRYVSFIDQPLMVTICAILTMIMFILRFLNGSLSIITFYDKKLREVGCGIYLLGSSIISLLKISVFALNFWLLFIVQSNLVTDHSFLLARCVTIEPLLKILFSMNNWLNACQVRYSPIMQIFNSIILIIHFIIPFSINLVSSIFIIKSS